MAAVRMWRTPTRAVSDIVSRNSGGFCCLRLSHRWQQRRYSIQTRELTEEAQYPPIKPRYPPGRWGSMTEEVAWKQHEECLKVASITDKKERLESLAGEKSRILWDLAPLNVHPGTLPFKQYITKTRIVEGLPEKCSGHLGISNFENIKAEVVNAILQEQYLVKSNISKELGSTPKESYSEDHNLIPPKSYSADHSLIRAILESILPYAIIERPHIQTAQLDENVRLESFIRRQGYDVTSDSDEDSGADSDEDSEEDNTPAGCHYFQAKCTASFQIRTEKPLVPFLPLDDPECSGDYPQEVYAPEVLGFRRYEDRPISVSGHWLGDPCEWCSLTVNAIGPAYDWLAEHHSAALAQQEMVPCGLVTAFTSAVAQAHNQGFNTFQELTYPIVAQTVVTNGLYFRFFCYQLNTLHLWKPDDANPLRNLLWVSPQLKLYETLEETQVHGFNDMVLSNLLHLMLNQPGEPKDDQQQVTPKHYINTVGEEPFPHPVIGRFQYPRNAVYF